MPLVLPYLPQYVRGWFVNADASNGEWWKSLYYFCQTAAAVVTGLGFVCAWLKKTYPGMPLFNTTLQAIGSTFLQLGTFAYFNVELCIWLAVVWFSSPNCWWLLPNVIVMILYTGRSVYYVNGLEDVSDLCSDFWTNFKHGLFVIAILFGLHMVISVSVIHWLFVLHRVLASRGYDILTCDFTIIHAPNWYKKHVWLVILCDIECKVQNINRCQAEFLRTKLQNVGVQFPCYIYPFRPSFGWDDVKKRHRLVKALSWQIVFAVVHAMVLSSLSSHSVTTSLFGCVAGLGSAFNIRRYPTCFAIPGRIQLSYHVCDRTLRQPAKMSAVQSWFEIIISLDVDADPFVLFRDVGRSIDREFWRSPMIEFGVVQSCVKQISAQYNIAFRPFKPQPQLNNKNLQFSVPHVLSVFLPAYVDLTEAQNMVKQSCTQACLQSSPSVCHAICNAVSTHVKAESCRRDENTIEHGGGIVVAYKLD